mmetsp:Transcript_131185/g.365646  ORF Transcript_131185/g.365646 Transcript_131185/m.365646 type:complete len:224 (+) Transcript_131185:494-1165(+)
MRPTEPAVDSKWPTCDLPVVIGSGFGRRWKQARIEPTSMGSPSAVPVPWFSVVFSSSGATPAWRREPRTHACCEGPFGAVRLALRPSWLMYEPTKHAILARTSFTSSLTLRRRPPTPSPRLYPLAPWSKDMHRPDRPSMPAPLRPTNDHGVRMFCVPIDSPQESSLIRCCRSMLWMMLAETVDDEQAVSTCDTGPVSCRVVHSLAEEGMLWTVAPLSHASGLS